MPGARQGGTTMSTQHGSTELGRPEFAFVPVELLRDPEISDRAVRVWCAAAALTGDLRVGDIADVVGISRDRAAEALRELVAHGWLGRSGA